MMSGMLDSQDLIKGYSKQVEKGLADNPSMQHVQLETAFVNVRKRHDEFNEESRQKEQYFDDTSHEYINQLHDISKKLEQEIQKFSQYVPDDLKDEISGKIFTWKDVADVVDRVRSRWEKRTQENRFKQASNYFRKFCKTINSHSNVLKMIPNESKYMSLFSGSLIVVIKAASAYEQITESFARSIMEINDEISIIGKHIQDHDDIQMQLLIIRLYTQIFTFLVNVMQWYTGKARSRLCRSLNESLYDKYKQQIDEIRSTSTLISREAQARTARDVLAIKCTAESIDESIMFLNDLIQRDQRAARMDCPDYFDIVHEHFDQQRKEWLTQNKQVIYEVLHRVFAERIAGNTITSHLEGQALFSSCKELDGAVLDTDPHTPLATTSHDNVLTARTSREPPANKTRKMLNGSDVKYLSRHLEDFFDDDRVQSSFALYGANHFADPRIVSALQSFVTASKGEVLHIQGAMEVRVETTLGRIAQSYCRLLRDTGIAVISYFCRLSDDEPPENRTRETIELVALVYSMIRQLIELLPDRYEIDTVDLSHDRFSQLDGTLRTWDEAITLLEDLIRLNQEPILIVVIDGLQWLDDHDGMSTSSELRELIELLRRVTNAGGDDESLKVLFTTAGPSIALGEVLDNEEIVSISPPRARLPGQSMHGMLPIPFPL